MNECSCDFVFCSHRALRKEREQLAKRMRTSLREEEREEMYQRWGVYTGGKQRKMQVAYRVWTDPHDEAHLQDSAEVVAKVMGFWNPSKEASKEMFELAFAPPSSKKPWLQAGWDTIISNLNALNM
jgi:centromeric protein E